MVRMQVMRFGIGFGIVMLCSFSATANEPVTFDNLSKLAPNSADEPYAKTFSLQKAARFLDTAALDWQKRRKCFTCHTNFAYLYARPMVSAELGAHKEVRRFAEELVSVRWEEKGPRWDAEVVASAAALSFNDSVTTGTLHPMTKVALDRMWTIQRDDGGWDWLKCDWPPMESDDDYGVSIALLAVGVAPDGYANSPAARKGLKGIRNYLNANPPPTVHHEAMLLWGASHLDGFLSEYEKCKIIYKLLSLQKADGGWNLASLGDWEREDSTAQDTKTSDGYATGFVFYVLRQAGVSANCCQLRNGICWLKNHQRESGRWFTRSLNKDSRHFISHAGTAFAVMAIQSCAGSCD